MAALFRALPLVRRLIARMLPPALLLAAATLVAEAAGGEPAIFPLPQEMTATGAALALDDTVPLLVPLEATEQDLLVAREFSFELSSRFGVGAQVQRVSRVPAAGRAIVIGRRDNPLVASLCAARGIRLDATHPRPEGYVLQVDERLALVAGCDDRGAFYGMQSLRQLLARESGRTFIHGAQVRDWPHKPFRGIKLYLPGPTNLAFFKRFVRDFMALNKYNELIVEMNASMQLDRHPELNAGWLELAQSLTSTRRNRPFGPKGEEQDSVHHDSADGQLLTKAEVAELVRFVRAQHIDVIPEIPSLSHAYSLITRRRDLAEMPDAEWPDAYCPSNPESRAVLFDVLGEYLEVMQPRMVHIGHDEWRVRLGACPRCRDRDARELYAEDVNAIHDWLAKQGVGTMIWGDHLIERLRQPVARNVKTPDGFAYQVPGGLTEQMVTERIPKDILVANWMWQEPYPGQGEVNDLDLARWGFRQFYGNFEPHLRNWARRSANPSVIGGAPSSWAATTEYNFGKDQIFDLMACANLLWSKHWPSLEELTAVVQGAMPVVRERLGGVRAWSGQGSPQRPVGLSLTAPARPARLRAGAVAFEFDPVAQPLRIANGEASPPLAINADVSSLVFLHATEKAATNHLSYRTIHNFEDTADLLGYYEIRYADGYAASVPVRYVVNILERTWSPVARPKVYCYGADPVVEADGRTYFAFEWRNPRLGKPVASVVFRAAAGFVDARGVTAAPNAVLLRALTAVLPREVKPVKAFTTEE